MRRLPLHRYFFYLVAISILLFSAAYLNVPVMGSVFPMLAGPFFAEKVTPEDILNKYQSGRIKILIVPGHDNNNWGTEFAGLREADLNLELGKYLYDFFSYDKKFETYLLRDGYGEYNSWFLDYINSGKEEVFSFRNKLREAMHLAISHGKINLTNKVYHNPAADNASINLYAINKWANDNDIDIVIHIHFNDYPRRRASLEGEYSGFTVYVPEKQLPNARVSKAVGKEVKDALREFSSVSNLPAESAGVVEDMELIAVGSNASRDSASLLVEYGYIYESQFIKNNIRDAVIKEFAFQTYRGIKNYFVPNSITSYRGYTTTLLPYKWNDVLKIKERSLDILSLQMALKEEGIYPPEGKDLEGCPINGYYGKCTEESVKIFQEKFGDEILKPSELKRGTGIIGPSTLLKLNELYGN